MQQVKPFAMFAVSLAVTAKGIHDFISAVTSVIGLITSCLGCAAAVYALIWWRNRVRKQSQANPPPEIDAE